MVSFLFIPERFKRRNVPVSFPADSVGLVTPQKFQFEEPLHLECDRVLPRFELMVETYGTLNADKSNAILICHALSGHHHAAGYHHEDDKKLDGGIVVLARVRQLIRISFCSFAQ